MVEFHDKISGFDQICAGELSLHFVAYGLRFGPQNTQFMALIL
jgi:hypothetical protein